MVRAIRSNLRNFAMLKRTERGNRSRRIMLGTSLPIISTVIARVMPIIGKALRTCTWANATDLPTIGLATRTNADHRQDGADDRQACSTDHRSSIERFNDYHRKAGTWLVAEPIDKPMMRPSGPLAAAWFVGWVDENGLAGEWKVADLWCLASEDFAPALNMVLPPRRVFLSALKKAPGVICTPNRRVYDRTGKLLGKTTFYQLPASPAVRTAAEISAMTVVKHAA